MAEATPNTPKAPAVVQTTAQRVQAFKAASKFTPSSKGVTTFPRSFVPRKDKRGDDMRMKNIAVPDKDIANMPALYARRHYAWGVIDGLTETDREFLLKLTPQEIAAAYRAR